MASSRGLKGVDATAGAAGTIQVTAASLTLTDGALISNSTFGPGRGGTITITAGSLTLAGPSSGGRVTSGIFAQAEGRDATAGAAGTIQVTVASLTLTKDTQISSSTSGPGRGGTISITATESLTLTDGALISSTTFGPGRGGTITITATESLTLAGTAPDGVSSGIFALAIGEETTAGAAGTIQVTAASLTLTDGAQISSTTFGPGRGGTITITATESLTLTDGARIASSTLGPGRGGTITITATESPPWPHEPGGLPQWHLRAG